MVSLAGQFRRSSSSSSTEIVHAQICLYMLNSVHVLWINFWYDELQLAVLCVFNYSVYGQKKKNHTQTIRLTHNYPYIFTLLACLFVHGSYGGSFILLLVFVFFRTKRPQKPTTVVEKKTTNAHTFELMSDFQLRFRGKYPSILRICASLDTVGKFDCGSPARTANGIM